MAARYSSGPRIFLSDARLLLSDSLPRQIKLNSNESHYLKDVLRLRVRDDLEVGDPVNGVVGLATVESLDSGLVVISVTKLLTVKPSPQREIIVLSALCKGDKNEQICDWSTELGCSEIHFWQSPRSVVRLKTETDLTQRQARLHKIAIAAAQQSKQFKPPVVQVHRSIDVAITKIQDRAQIDLYLCSLEPGAKLLSEVCHLSDQNKAAVLIIGPEGDLAPEECSLLIDKWGAIPVSLGPSVLRSELAVVSSVATIRAFSPS